MEIVSKAVIIRAAFKYRNRFARTYEKEEAKGARSILNVLLNAVTTTSAIARRLRTRSGAIGFPSTTPGGG